MCGRGQAGMAVSEGQARNSREKRLYIEGGAGGRVRHGGSNAEQVRAPGAQVRTLICQLPLPSSSATSSSMTLV